MSRIDTKGLLLIFIVCILTLLLMQTSESSASPESILTDQELDNLLAPIALYPDPLLAQILPASTYPEEISDAQAWLNRGGTMSSIDRQDWDESVKAIAYYPSILNMMAGNMDWTADLGDAFLNQPEDVTLSIQRLRWQAREAGNLESTSEQTVVIEGNYIKIIPVQPQYAYIPQYDPSVVYIERREPGDLPFITFGLGLMIGGWLTLDFDWGHHHVIYHGWNRPGWVNHARPHVHVRNVYVDRSRPYIRQTWRHDLSRGDPERYRALHPGSRPKDRRYKRTPEIRGRAIIPSKPSREIFGPRGDTHSFSNRGKNSRDTVQSRPMTPSQDKGRRQLMPAPGASPRPAQTAPGISKGPTAPTRSIKKGSPQPPPARESLQPARTPSITFGGYRGNNEAKSQSLRGKDSRQSSGGIRAPAPVRKGSAPSGKGEHRGGAPAGRDDIKGKMRK
jgi:hypothetical protein